MLRYIAVGLIRGALESCRDNEIQYGCAVMERSLIRFLGRLGFSLSTLPGWLSITCKAALCCVGQSDRVDGRGHVLVAPRGLDEAGGSVRQPGREI